MAPRGSACVFTLLLARGGHMLPIPPTRRKRETSQNLLAIVTDPLRKTVLSFQGTSGPQNRTRRTRVQPTPTDEVGVTTDPTSQILASRARTATKTETSLPTVGVADHDGAAFDPKNLRSHRVAKIRAPLGVRSTSGPGDRPFGRLVPVSAWLLGYPTGATACPWTGTRKCGSFRTTRQGGLDEVRARGTVVKGRLVADACRVVRVQ